MTEIRIQVSTSIEIPCVILNQVLQGISMAVLTRMSKSDSICKTIKRVRNLVSSIPHLPTDLNFILIPENLQQSKSR